jgi:hypothetical protein
MIVLFGYNLITLDCDLFSCICCAQCRYIITCHLFTDEIIIKTVFSTQTSLTKHHRQRCLKYHTDDDNTPVWLRLTFKSYILLRPVSVIVPKDHKNSCLCVPIFWLCMYLMKDMYPLWFYNKLLLLTFCPFLSHDWPLP